MYAAPVRACERELHSIPKQPTPFDTIHLDFFGPLPSLNPKRKHMLVVIDAFTKHVKLYPVNSTSAREVLACLEKYISYYSRPRRVITDQGTCFTSLEFTERMKKWNIDTVRVAAGSPQANGQAERALRVVKSILGKLSEPISHADWALRLPEVEYAINNSTHSSTKYTRSELLFGTEQRGTKTEELSELIQKE